jgi:hypothetical protein
LRTDRIFQEATAKCEAALLAGAGQDYFMPVVARSGAFKAIQQSLQQGSKPENLRIGPPLIQG